MTLAPDHISGAPAINPTWLRRLGTLCAISLFKRVRKDDLGVLFPTPKLCVKYGRFVEFVRQSGTGGSLYDQRLPGLALTYPVKMSPRCGPFNDIGAFHRWLRRPVLEPKDSYDQEINDLIAAHETTDWGSPIITHGDLSSLNILVQGEKVAGIIDWETSGWFPDYWEYITASQVNPRNLMWSNYIDGFLEPSPDDWSMEQLRLRYFGDT